MKRVGNIYEHMTMLDAIKKAIVFSSEGKTRRPEVRKTIENIDEYAQQIKTMLDNGTYTPSPYKAMTRYDHRAKKTRSIMRPEYNPDQIIHWLLINGLKNIFMRGMYYYNCGSVEGRGIKHGVLAVKKWLRADRKHTKYALKLDIKKFYDSLPQAKLLEVFARKIKDEKILRLLESVARSTPRGVSIGNYTSQWFANVYLEKLDHFIKQELGVKYYVRYIDDMVLFSHNKKELHKARKKIFEFLRNELQLEVKENWQLFPVASRGVDFLGYVFFHTHTKLRARNFLAFRRNCAAVRKKIKAKLAIPFKLAAGLLSRIGLLKFADLKTAKKKIYNSIHKNINKILKGVVSYASKRKFQPAAVHV